jgi:hypothetical protein
LDRHSNLRRRIQRIDDDLRPNAEVPEPGTWSQDDADALLLRRDRRHIAWRPARAGQINGDTGGEAEHYSVAILLQRVGGWYAPVEDYPAVAGVVANPHRHTVLAGRRGLPARLEGRNQHGQRKQHPQRSHQSKLASNRSISACVLAEAGSCGPLASASP